MATKLNIIFANIFSVINPSGSEAWIFWQNQASAMAADGLAPDGLARSSAAMVLIM